jgi:hypothetical protein
MRNGGSATGVPPIFRCATVVAWEHDLQAAMENLQDEIDTVGEEAASMDAYAATDASRVLRGAVGVFLSAHPSCTGRPLSSWCMATFHPLLSAGPADGNVVDNGLIADTGTRTFFRLKMVSFGRIAQMLSSQTVFYRI